MGHMAQLQTPTLPSRCRTCFIQPAPRPWCCAICTESPRKTPSPPPLLARVYAIPFVQNVELWKIPIFPLEFFFVLC